MSECDYYVYVYIDPRNLQEFYYGKGRGTRRFSHLRDASDSEKSRTIREIQEAGLQPLIRVIARGLTEDQALLIEKTLIWKLGKNLTNISSGHYAKNFRPHNTLHKDLYGFDFQNSVYYVNVGEGDHRNWDDCKRFGFLAAGQDWEKWGRKLYVLNEGDIVVAYLGGHGYVGIGRVSQKAQPATAFRSGGKPLLGQQLVQPKLLEVEVDLKDEEHVIGVDWIRIFDRTEAKWKKNAGLFTTQLVVASLENQGSTLEFLEREFSLSLSDLLETHSSKREVA